MNKNVTIDRHKYIGGSDLPTILGLNAKYNTNIFEFAKEKARIIPTKFKGNQFTKYGQVMEPIIREYINAIHNTKYLEDTIIDETKAYRGNTDGIDRNSDIPILEIKTFGEELNIDYYEPQCQFYMETFNQDTCKLVGYKRPEDFYTGIDYELENDDSFFNFSFDDKNIVEHTIVRNKDYWAKIELRIIAFQKAVDKLKANPNMSEIEFYSLFYGEDVITISNKISILEKKLLSFKDIEKENKKLKEDLYKIFDERNILSLDTGTTKITKVNPTSYDTIGVDVEQLKVKYKKIFEELKTTKTTNKKGYILITQKKEEKENVITK